MQGSQKVDNMAQNIKIEGGNTGKKKEKIKSLVNLNRHIQSICTEDFQGWELSRLCSPAGDMLFNCYLMSV